MKQSPDFVSVARASELTGVPYPKLLEMAKGGQLPAVHIGNRWLLHERRAREVLAQRAEQAMQAEGGEQ